MFCLWSRNRPCRSRLFTVGRDPALIDVVLIDGVDSAEGAELRAANKRIKALEKELQLVKDASELFDAQAVVPPKDGRPLPEN